MASTAKTTCHPCRAKGMAQINYFIAPERKIKFKHYCKMRQVSMTSMLNSLAAKELEDNYERIERSYNWLLLHKRAEGYRYLRTGRHSKPIPRKRLLSQHKLPGVPIQLAFDFMGPS